VVEAHVLLTLRTEITVETLLLIQLYLSAAAAVEVLDFLVLKLVGQVAAEGVTTVRLGRQEQATKVVQVLLAVAPQRVAVEVARQQQEVAKMVVMVLPARQMVHQPHVLAVAVAQEQAVRVGQAVAVLGRLLTPQQRQGLPTLALVEVDRMVQQEATVRVRVALA
tara:strand:+ start:219 stop:713 length:495 start_codon:yes stop_codon:yes gene_type:complete